MLQNESTDEELEHFEDIVDETENEPNSIIGKQEDEARSVEKDGVTNSDNHSSEDDDDDSPAFYSEDEVSDEAGEFLLKDDSKNTEKSKTSSSCNGQQPQASLGRSWLPGGYNPRHREPSFWSVFFSNLL